jgi:hypothetical protein
MWPVVLLGGDQGWMSGAASWRRAGRAAALAGDQAGHATGSEL